MREALRSRARWALVVGVFAAFLLAAQPASAVKYEVGDVFAAVGSGTIRQFSPSGVLKDNLDTQTGGFYQTGMCFSEAGNLYSTNFTANNMTKFDDAGNVLKFPFGSGFNSHPESCTALEDRGVYVGQAESTGDILHFTAATGDFLESFNPARERRGTDWLDFSVNECTIYYTSEGRSVKRFNVCTNTQLSDFATGLPGSNAYAIRLLPGGGALVADTQYIVRLNAKGTVVQTYPGSRYNASLLFALNLDPDGETFWTADYNSDRMYRIDIESGTLVTQFSGRPISTLAGITVYGERCRTCAPTLDLEPDNATNPAGSKHSLTAKLTNPTGPLANQTILFKVTGANPRTASVTTDAEGNATLTYTGTKVGTDTITACFDEDKNGSCDPPELVRDTATKRWEAPPEGPPWEGWVTNFSSGCSGRVQVPFLDSFGRVTAFAEIFCPNPTQLTFRARLRSDYDFRDITVDQYGCLGSNCVITQPKGYNYYRLTCPKSDDQREDQRYYSSLVFYPGTRSDLATSVQSSSRSLSPLCDF